MGKVVRSILRIIVQGGYYAVKGIKRAYYAIAGLFSKNPHKNAISASAIVNKRVVVSSGKKKHSKVNAARVEGTPIQSVKKPRAKLPWWKDWRILAGGAVVVAATAVALVLALTGVGAGSGQEALAALDEPIQTSARTVEASEADSASQPTSIPTTAPTHDPVATTEPDDPELLPGVDDVRIIEIQERLMELGYMEYDEPTPHYGFVTENALGLFQRKHNLQVDGIVGQETLTALFADDAHPYTVKIGDRGYDVQLLQDRLAELNYMAYNSTSYFGTDTEKAVKRFQDRNGLYEDGNVGEQTREVLFSDGAKAERVSSSSGGSSGGGSSSGGSGPIAYGDPDDASADALIDFALTQLGKKYVRGGKGPDVFDCSGFVYFCLNSVGYRIKYMTSGGWGASSLPRVEKMSDMKKGDIICFKGHVGIYMGGDKMVDASSGNGKIVTRSNISKSSYWTRTFICARRVF